MQPKYKCIQTPDRQHQPSLLPAGKAEVGEDQIGGEHPAEDFSRYGVLCSPKITMEGWCRNLFTFCSASISTDFVNDSYAGYCAPS